MSKMAALYVHSLSKLVNLNISEKPIGLLCIRVVDPMKIMYASLEYGKITSILYYEHPYFNKYKIDIFHPMAEFQDH